MDQPELDWENQLPKGALKGSRKTTWSERLVLCLFEREAKGGLRLRYPDGATRVLGTPGAPVTAKIDLRDEREFFRRVAAYAGVGFGEAYVDGVWDTDDIVAVIRWLILNTEEVGVRRPSNARLWRISQLALVNRWYHRCRDNTVAGSRRNIAEHYDLGNDFYQVWLDPTMTYSSALFASADQTLEEAQTAKYEALCRKLRLRSGDHVLEIGCGWGGFSEYAAANYGCRITAVTISREQAKFARERLARANLDHLVEVRLQDYREISGQFDKIVSIEMLEAVGDRHLETYFRKCAEVLKQRGIMALQYITVPDCRYSKVRSGVDWIQKHIFPGSDLLSVARVNAALNATGDLFLHDLEDLGASYARTLAVWHDQFTERFEEVRKLGFDDRFRRKWQYYLKYCEAAFAARNNSVVQAVYSRPNNTDLDAGWA